MRDARLLLCSILLTLVLPTPAGAGEQTVREQIDAIRALYREVGTLERAPEGEGPPVLRMEQEQVLPGTGPQTTRLSFVLGEHRVSEEQVYADLYVRKVTASWNFAARGFSAEYLFAVVDEQLVFHFLSDGERELRIWFHEGQAIRTLRKPVAGSEAGGQPEQKEGGYSEEEQAAITAAQARAASLLELYGSSSKAIDGQHAASPD